MESAEFLRDCWKAYQSFALAATGEREAVRVADDRVQPRFRVRPVPPALDELRPLAAE